MVKAFRFLRERKLIQRFNFQNLVFVRLGFSKKSIFPLVIAAFFLTMAWLFVRHLISGQNIDPVATFIQPLNLSIYWSTILVVIGVLVGTTAAERYGRILHERLSSVSQETWHGDTVWQVVMPCLIWGVIGARLEVVFFPAPSLAQIGIHSFRDFLEAPYLMISLSAGGLGVSGAILGGLWGLFWFCRRRKLRFGDWLDTAVFGLAIGQSIGRWGDFINQEFYGRPSSVPWSIAIDPVERLSEVAQFETFHPAFLYESMWTLLIFIGLVTILNRCSELLQPGMLTSAYFFLYAVGRIVIAIFRLNLPVLTVGSIEIPVIIIYSIAVATVSALYFCQKTIVQ